MKYATACVQCRLAKKRCVFLHGHNSCSYCRLKGLAAECSTALAGSKRQQSPQDGVPASHRLAFLPNEANKLLTMEARIELVDLYLRYIHDRPQTIFHVPSLRDQIQTGSTSEALLLALCSLGCRFSTQDSLQALEDVLTKASKAALHSKLASKDLDTVQACVLVANLCAANMDPDGEALYFGFATCIARIMRLPEIQGQDDAITREVKCRIWWTLFMADRWCSAGLGLPCQMPSIGEGEVSFPTDENLFQNADCGYTAFSPPPEPGLWAYKITLVQVFADIQGLYRQVVKESMKQQQIDERLSQLAISLDEWEQGLPVHIRFSPATLQAYHDRGLGGTFVDMHLGFHYYATLLFFIHLDTQKPYSLDATHYSRLCKHHALQFSRLLTTSRTTPGCEAVHATVGHMTVVSSAVLIHTLLFETDEMKRSTSREGLLSNFETLLQLQKLWPSMNTLISRLLRFQNDCLRSVDDHTHRVDPWMTDFLLEYNPSPNSSTDDTTKIDRLLNIRYEQPTMQGTA